jgi:hypothetical protein
MTIARRAIVRVYGYGTGVALNQLRGITTATGLFGGLIFYFRFPARE